MSEVSEFLANSFYQLTVYYLRELLGEFVFCIDIDTTGQYINISEEEINKIFEDEKLQEQTSFYTLYPMFDKFKLKTEDKELDKKYWKLLKSGKLPTDFNNLKKDDLIYLIGPLAKGKKGDMKNYNIEELRKILESENKLSNKKNE